MITYIGYKDAPIDFDGRALDGIVAQPEEARAIVRKDNGKYAIAHYCYRRFDDGTHWVIWTDDEYPTHFGAMRAANIVFKTDRGWRFENSVRYVKAA